MTSKSHPRFAKGAENSRWIAEVSPEHMSTTFGHLSIVSNEVRREPGKRPKILCTCSLTGVTRWTNYSDVMKGKSQSFAKGGRLFDPIKHVLGNRFRTIRSRCTNPKNSMYYLYGGRGITCEFQSTEEFRQWALEVFPNTDFKGLEFDRIDSNKHYTRDNIRLVTPSENQRNRRDSAKIMYKGALVSIYEFPSPYARDQTVHYAKMGLTGEKILELHKLPRAELRQHLTLLRNSK